MWLLGVGVVLLVMKWLELGPVAAWSWWGVLAPFAGAVAWWAWSDASGFTKRRVLAREAARQQERRDKQREQLGHLPRKNK